MLRITHIGHLAIAVGLLASTACRNDDTRKNAENAAEAVRDKTDDLKDNASDLKETAHDNVEAARDNVGDLKNPTKDLNKDAIALRDAQKDFEYQRLVRTQTLRTIHAITASQPNLINSLASARPLVAEDRAKVQDKLQVMQMRLDEAANAIQGLTSVDATHWEANDRAAADAMNRLEDARSDAWEALDDARLLDDRTSMR